MTPESMLMQNAPWYVVQSKPRQETVAVENLQRQGYHCFFPRLQVTQLRRGRREQRIEALFPRYLFVQLAFGDTNIAPIRSTLGVSGLVRFGMIIPEVPQQLMTTLMQRCNEQGIIVKPEAKFTTGQRVRIEMGAFEGLEGIIFQQRGEDRVILLLDVLGKQRRVTTDIKTIAAIT
ncbi:MAG: transcription/translation regulatory transformer protein RfaH [Gammaproteobacteria bacterium]|nr:transcription/translation regulatory transformer protein RfaH [Gammaproteobacteria bacterium]